MSLESIRARVEAVRLAGWANLRGLHLVSGCQNHGPVENCLVPTYQRDVKTLQDGDRLLPALLRVAEAAAKLATVHEDTAETTASGSSSLEDLTDALAQRAKAWAGVLTALSELEALP